MKRSINYLFALVLLSISAIARGYDGMPASEDEQLCYARAMIGLDSVINSRLGVPAEHALDLAVLHHLPISSSSNIYSKPYLNTILDAYLWEESPHSYAVKVFYRCASEQGANFSVMNNWLVTE